MKKVVVLVISIGLLLLGKPVLAKDAVYSLNKYPKEQLDYLLKDSNGYVMAGTFEKKEQNTQVVLLKYKKNGTLEWKYSYGEDQVDELYGLSYLYDESHNIMGYVLVVGETTNEERDTSPHFLLIDLEGKLIREQETHLSYDAVVHKIEMIENEDNIDGYLVVGTQNQKGFIAKYNRDLNLVWENDYPEMHSSIDDVISVQENYYVVLSKEIENQIHYALYQYNESSNSYSILKDDFEENIKPHLEKEKNSYLIYGITNDVKLSKNQVGSYYFMKYNLSNEEEWETIGNTSIDKDKVLKIQAVELDNHTMEYYILSTNRADNSIEVIRANQDGVLQEKVKKIKNDYYNIHDFLFQNGTLCFIGQINCPEEDNCDYNEKSLFLISTEDKVIEVKDHDSGYILGGIIIVVVMMGIVYSVRKKRKLTQTKRKKMNKKNT